MTSFQSEVILTGWRNQERSRLCTLREQITLSWRSHPSRRWISRLVLGQNFQRARADGPQPDHPQAQGTLLACGFGEANSR